MKLSEYKRKRHFDVTSEPKGKVAAANGRSFCIQKHRASHLHYDFRLELDGVLKSWAVPKGPSLDPTVKRLAMHVEDHPVSYGSFEGIIPEGEYGAGEVLLWDQGQWEPTEDPHKGYHSGRLKFKLNGAKLRGGWVLIRTGGRGEKDQRRWLLFKERDEEARSEADGDVLDELPLSVVSDRSLEDIAAGKIKRKGRQTAPKRGGSSQKKKTPKYLRLPRKIDVQLATLAKEAPEGEQWLHEIKFDGYRMICRIEDGSVQFITRNHNDWTKRLPELAKAALQLPATNALLDGEVVAMRADGATDFQELQNAFRDQLTQRLQYFVFDLLAIDGHDLTALPLEKRKELLHALLERDRPDSIHFSEHIDGNGSEVLKEACAKHLEGIVSKRRDRPYQSGRGYDWLKVKCTNNEEFVICGYTDPSGSRTGFGALLLGSHNEKGQLACVGRVGTGFDERTLKTLLSRLKSLEKMESPFHDRKRERGKIHWVEPKLIAQIAFGSRTREGILRHASFQGLREDKPATEVVREKAIVPVATKRSKGQLKSQGSELTYDAQQEQFAGTRLTSPEKVLWPDAGVTKLELANYYKSIADWILPQIADRPLVLVRCPQGQGGECFFQKHPTAGSPGAFRLVPVREKTKTEKYVVVDDVEGLISLAQISALEIHAWGSRSDKLDQPDRLIFDLDPDAKVSWKRVVDSAQQFRQFLQELKLESFVKTTGGKGLHLVVPIERRHDWKEAKAFCKMVADAIVAADPEHYTANMSKAARSGKIFIDYLRNDRGSTAVVAYSPRARPDAPVSTPLAWKELSADIPSTHYTIRNILNRLTKLKRDPWEKLAAIRQSLGEPIKKLEKLLR